MQTETKKLLVKVGSDTLTNSSNNLDRESVLRIASQLASCMRSGIHTALVSSGAIAAGRESHPDSNGLEGQSLKQFLAMVGQPRLIRAYSDALNFYNIISTQILLTRSNFENEAHLKNLKAPLLQGFSGSTVLPIINANDAVTVNELSYTDNDELTMNVATILDADIVLFLTSTDGVYNKCPQNSDAALIRNINSNDFDLDSISFGEATQNGTGGMECKLDFALRIARQNRRVFIANGTRERIIEKCLNQSSDAPYTLIR